MKRFILVTIAFALLTTCNSVFNEEYGDLSLKKGEKVLICHKGHVISVSVNVDNPV